MANVIKTVLTYQLDGSNRDFNIPFEYLARKFVVVTLIGVDRKVLTINTDYRFATRTTISLTKAWGPADGYTTIELRRVTSTTDRLVDFTDGSILRAYDLNVAQIQTMHVAEEARDLTADTIGVNNDGHLDARGRRIVNLANAVDDRDAVPFGQLKTMNQNSWQARNEALQFRNEAETFRNQAEGFKSESSTNATNTKQWRDEAKVFRDEAEQFKNTAGQYATSAGNSATAAYQSEVNAENSATASANSAHLAEQQADRAKTEADKLENNNAFAGTLDSITQPTPGALPGSGRVDFKDGFSVNAPTLRADKGAMSLGRKRVAGDGTTETFINLYNGDASLGAMRFTNDGNWHFTPAGDGVGKTVYIDADTLGVRSLYSGVHFSSQPQGGALQFLRMMNPSGEINASNLAFSRYLFQGRGGIGAEVGAFCDSGIREVVGSTFEYFIHLAGFNTDWWWGFRNDGTLRVSNTIFNPDGNVHGNAWGGWLSDYLRNNFSAHLITADPGYAAVWRANGIPEGWGRVTTAAVNGNADDLLDGVHFRSLRNYYHNGAQNNIY